MSHPSKISTNWKHSRRGLATTLRCRTIGLALATLVLGGACSGQFPGFPSGHVLPVPGGSATEAVVGSPGPLNPLFEQEDNARDIDSLVYQGLTAVDARQNPVPLLAESWTVSEDRLSYTFRLRQGVRWADGKPFGMDDVMFTFGVLQSKEYQQPSGQYWKEVRVERQSDLDIHFTLKAPAASFPIALRQGILPKHAFDGVPVSSMALDAHSGGRAIGTGPFRVASISRDRKQVTLDRNPFARPKAWLDHLTFKSYPSLGDAVDAVSRGEADAVGALQPPQIGSLSRRPDLSVRQLPTFSFAAVLINLAPETSVYFNPPAVRQALSQAIDRRRLVNEVLEGRAEPAPGPIPPSHWAFAREQAEKLSYDPAQAARTLDEAEWTYNPKTGLRARGGRDFSVRLVTADAYPYRQVAEAVSAQLRQVGVELKVEPVPASVLVGRYLVGKQYQMAMAAFDNGPDPDQFSLWHSGAPPNTLNFASPLTPKQALIDKDLEDGRAGDDRAARKQAYADFQDLMGEAAPALFLFEPHYAYITAKRLRGVRTNPVIAPVDRFQYAAEWYVRSKGG